MIPLLWTLLTIVTFATRIALPQEIDDIRQTYQKAHLSAGIIGNIENYELTTPVEFSAANLKGYSSDTKIFQISTNSSVYDLILQRQTHFDNVAIDYLTDSFQRKFLRNNNCFYLGRSNSFNGEIFDVALNYCNGLEGLVRNGSDVFFIQPVLTDIVRMKNEQKRHIVYRTNDTLHNHVAEGSLWKEPVNAPRVTSYVNSTQRRFRRSGYESFITLINKSRRRVQLYYLDSYNKEMPFISFLLNERRSVNTFHGTRWLARDDKTNKMLLLDGKKYYTARLNHISRRTTIEITTPANMVFERVTTKEVEGDDYHVEVMVLADESVTRFHGKDYLEKYLLTMFNIASLVFKDKSLGVKLNFKLVRIVILEGNRRQFQIHNLNPTRSLVSACKYIKSLRQPEGHRDHFDFAVVLTREDFGPSGFAQLYSMCTNGRGCTLVKDEGLASAFIIAHETGHLLGLDHDGEVGARECKVAPARGSVMADIIVARYDRFHWSKCSRKTIQENIVYFDCLKNEPRYPIASLNEKLPGRRYTLDQQCQFNFDKQHTLCKSFTFDPCMILWCTEPNKPTHCNTMRGPALEGSICGESKHCLNGKCTPMNYVYESGGPSTASPVVHGAWSSWQAWSACSHTCGVGVRSRTRTCTNPRPARNGRNCAGESVMNEICSTQKCSKVKSFLGARKQECTNLEGNNGWTLYTDRPFEMRLRQRRSNLNCTFDTDHSRCNWVYDNRRSQITWDLNKGKTSSYGTGPDYDHTTRRGKYLYLEASSTTGHTKKEGDVARLVSPDVNVPRICFTMYYHMRGKDMGKLRVGILHRNGSEVFLWQQKDSVGRNWMRAQVSFESAESYRILIEGVRGIHWSGDIAIDDLSAVAGLCQDKRPARNPCQVSCRSRDARQFRMNVNVTDGLLCTNSRRSHDICMAGECVNFGCDNKLGSNLRVDDCGICGGESRTCYRSRGRREVLAKRQYEFVKSIPRGATFINITEDSSHGHLFGIRRRGGRGAHLGTKPDSFVKLGDSNFHFTKSEAGKQLISANGPTTLPLEVVVYTFTRQRNDRVGIRYEYYEPRDVITYKYDVTGWMECSRTCGIGQQQAVLGCKRSDGARVSERSCSHLKKPQYLRACHASPCKERYKWQTQKWRKCSKTCDGGERARIVTCIRNHDNRISDNRYCPKPEPQNAEKCNTKACPRAFRWQVNEWSSCSQTCGVGQRTRTVTCVDERTRYLVDARRCHGSTRPDRVEPCTIQGCDVFNWEVRMEGQCSASCGRYGSKLRIVYCVNQRNKAIVDNYYCDGPSPPRIIPCNRHACPEFVWNIEKLGTCSRSCGWGKIERRVTCDNKQNNKAAGDSNCHGEKPKQVEDCNYKTCESYEIQYGEWQPCSSLCGAGVQKRAYKCVVGGRPIDTKLCNLDALKIERPCKSPDCSSIDKVTCNFDKGNFCNWQNDAIDDFDWTINNRTPSAQTGPLHDHTGRGLFAFIESSSPRKGGDKASLVSPALRHSRGDACFSLWYHMRGLNIGTLKIHHVTREKRRLVFSKERRQGSIWLRAEVDVQPSGQGFRFLIEGSVGNGVYADIAIDDITFHRKKCKDVKPSVASVLRPDCYEVSPYCKNEKRRMYCLQSHAYQSLCCKTCAQYL